MRRCTFCMRETDDDHICRHCKHDENEPANPRHLPPKTVIGDQYMVGRALEQTDEAIIYAALDMATEQRIRIYEYFPRRYGRRNTRTLEVAAVPGSETQFADGMEVLRSRMSGVGCRMYEGNGTIYTVVSKEQEAALKGRSIPRAEAAADAETERARPEREPVEYIDEEELSEELEDEEYEEERIRRRNRIIMAIIGVLCVLLLALGIWLITRDSVDRSSDTLPTLLPVASAIATQQPLATDAQATALPTPDPSTGFRPIATDNPSWTTDDSAITHPDNYTIVDRPTRRPTEVPAPTMIPAATALPTSPVTGEVLVWYTGGGVSYHINEHCQGMQNAKLHTLSEAAIAGKKRCTVCNPPELPQVPVTPTLIPTAVPTAVPTQIPLQTQNPWVAPTQMPTAIPTLIPTESPAQPTQPSQLLVWYTSGGRSYHSVEHCQGMNGASQHTVAEAIAAGKQWCDVCQPPQPGFIPVETPLPTVEPQVTGIPTMIPTQAPTQEPVPTEIAQSLVWYTSGGVSYHIDEHCQGMNNAAQHTLIEAIAAGKQQCTVCNPPVLPAVQTEVPTLVPADAVTAQPQSTELPTEIPDIPQVTDAPAITEAPTIIPTEEPAAQPTETPTELPTEVPTELPTELPTEVPTEVPTEEPTEVPTEEPTEVPTEEPTEEPTEVPTEAPTEEPTAEPITEASPYYARDFMPDENSKIVLDNGSQIWTLRKDDRTVQTSIFDANGGVTNWFYFWVQDDGLYRSGSYDNTDPATSQKVIGDLPKVGDPALGGTATVAEVTEEGVLLSNGDQVIHGFGILPAGTFVDQTQVPGPLNSDEVAMMEKNRNPFIEGAEIVPGGLTEEEVEG